MDDLAVDSDEEVDYSKMDQVSTESVCERPGERECGIHLLYL